jgi:hypothetical protein
MRESAVADPWEQGLLPWNAIDHVDAANHGVVVDVVAGG